ncbi:hypothetical protein SS50377_23047 [Spironucleus salmonicida]|uniref:Thioredoxin-like fold domain-containing protein n=1 Tax=Spironucleus salmonicida TaxID=348837 RepID=V6M2Y2_9EUKA|nr:hypothetical protein SS50377_23047 [Spironucleus salmonicida]|eukprot:EST47624.1 Hypothetical protein SS50377_12318 [Spironucleus salmonicida]
MILLVARLRTATTFTQDSLVKEFASFGVLYTGKDHFEVVQILNQIQKTVPKKHFPILHAKCQENTKICDQIDSLPSFVVNNISPKGSPSIRYKGDFSYQDLEIFIRNHITAPLGQFTDYNGFNKQISENKTEIWSFFRLSKDAYETFIVYDICIEFMQIVTPCLIQDYNENIKKQINNVQFTDFLEENEFTIVIYSNGVFTKYVGEVSVLALRRWFRFVIEREQL